jgi:PPK2 family polyphosphate:nucleotide phosphotransferase
MINTDPYRVAPGAAVDLNKIKARDDGGLDKDEGRELFRKLIKRMQELQELLFAENKHALLVVLQAMDAGGKDSTIHNVFGPINPQGCRVIGFKAPSERERGQDFLWRIHQHTPAKGRIGVFNRSHYEDVLIVRVKGLAPEKTWRARYDHINAFEKLLHDEGTAVLKFYLHITKAYQKKRLQRRLDRPDKQWKFNPDDLKERARWHEYRAAFEDAISKCSTHHAPWYVVPAQTRWHRNLIIAQTVVQTLESFDMKYPGLTYDPTKIQIE